MYTFRGLSADREGFSLGRHQCLPRPSEPTDVLLLKGTSPNTSLVGIFDSERQPPPIALLSKGDKTTDTLTSMLPGVSWKRQVRSNIR
jgi:hypothetical protein